MEFHQQYDVKKKLQLERLQGLAKPACSPFEGSSSSSSSFVGLDMQL
jgi:hypothetical protein